MTTYADRVIEAPSPLAAMVVLAEGLDRVLQELGTLADEPKDPWSIWAGGDASGNHVIGARGALKSTYIEPEAFQATRAPRNDEAIAAVEAKLLTAVGEDRVALEAQLRLLKDDGASIDVSTPAGRRESTAIEGDTAVVTIPTPSRERQLIRTNWAIQHQLAEFCPTLTPEEVHRAFALGGPTWLYHGNRDAVMQMPAAWRRELVSDLEQDSPAAAQEMARDILKDDEPHGNMAISLDGIVGDD